MNDLPPDAVYDRRRSTRTRALLLLRETEEVVRLFGTLPPHASSAHLLASFDRLADALARWRADPRCRCAEEAAFATAYMMRSAWRWEMDPFQPLALSAVSSVLAPS